MKKSLKASLQSLIISHGYVSTKEIEEFCRQHSFKISNGERRLRELKDIEAVREKNYIVGYKPRKIEMKLYDGQGNWIGMQSKEIVTYKEAQTKFPAAFAPEKEVEKGLFWP